MPSQATLPENCFIAMLSSGPGLAPGKTGKWEKLAFGSPHTSLGCSLLLTASCAHALHPPIKNCPVSGLLRGPPLSLKDASGFSLTGQSLNPKLLSSQKDYLGQREPCLFKETNKHTKPAQHPYASHNQGPEALLWHSLCFFLAFSASVFQVSCLHGP